MNIDYPELLDVIKDELAEGRTESHAFLLWFLKNYYRLDEIAAVDSVCDGPGDKGVDAIYVDDNLETIDIFQSKLVQNPRRTLGDTQIKEFAGTLEQFRDADNVARMAETTDNVELANLLKSENVTGKVADGYTVRGIFLTNIEADRNAKEYLVLHEGISLFDKIELESSYVPAGPTAPVGNPVSFDVFGYNCIECNVGDVRAIFAPLKASELIQLDGIASNELFAWNVRGSLGRTKVNKDISRTIENKKEHNQFILFHNGLTLLCSKLKYENDRVEISGYSVVNGCQSLTSRP